MDFGLVIVCAALTIESAALAKSHPTAALVLDAFTIVVLVRLSPAVWHSVYNTLGRRLSQFCREAVWERVETWRTRGS